MSIRIINRSLDIPISERNIGYTGDNLVEVRIFELNRYYGNIDLSEFDFKLDTEINGTKNIIDLDKAVSQDKITLTWTIAESHILTPGRMNIQIRVFNSAGEEKWHSAQDYVLVQPSINATEAQPDPLPSEFVQMEQRVTAAKNQAQAAAETAEQQADRAQGIADTFENTTLPAAIQSVEQAVEEQIGIAKGHADRAQELADTFEQTTLPAAITAVEAAGQAKVDLAEQQAERVEDIIREAEQDVLPKLRQAIEDGIETKDQLGGSIQEAGEAKTALDGSISAAGPAKTGLDGSISSAGVAKTQLDGSISSANGIKSQLDGSITAAGQAKELLDESIATSDLDSFKADYMQFKNDSTLKSAKIEKELNDYKATLAGMNPNHEPKQKVNGYGIVSLPKNAANGQVSVILKGNTWTNRAGIGDTSPQTIENLDSAKTYLLIKTDGGTVNVDAVDTAVPAKITGKTSTVLTWTSGKIALYELSTAEAALTEAQLGARYHYVSGTKSTVSASRLKSVGKNLFDGDVELGTIRGSTGEPTTSPVCVRTKNFVPVKPNTTYRISNDKGYSTENAYAYDYNKNYIGVLVGNAPFTTGATTHYIKWRTRGEPYNENDLTVKFQLEEGNKATPYEPYTESTQYLPNVGELRSLPNGTKDEIDVVSRRLIKRIGEKTNVSNGTVINYTDMAENGTYYAWNENGETETGIKGDTLGIDATTLIYQLAEPVEMPIQTSGSLVSYPSGTVYIEPYVADAGIYTDKMSVLHQDLPIKVLEKLSKIDFMTGLEIELDVSDAIIAEDKLSFTHPDLVEGDIVFFVYEYDQESTEGETEIEYYDSRYVIKDSVTEKFYKWHIAVAEGVPSIELVEV